MTEANKPTAADATREDPTPSKQTSSEQPSTAAPKSIEMEDLSSSTSKLTPVAAAPADVGEDVTVAAATADLPKRSSIGEATENASADKETTNDSRPSASASVSQVPGTSEAAVDGDEKTNASGVVATTPAVTVPEQDSLTIDPVGSAADEASPSDLIVDIMLIVTQSNSRHPFRISEKYLTKRNVTVPGRTEDDRLDPMSITVYTLKELILRDWRKEWEAPPREPVSIRLIYFGKMLEDKLPLSHYNFSHTAKNVVHMTVKPQEIIDEEEANKKVKDSGAASRGGGCCVIL